MLEQFGNIPIDNAVLYSITDKYKFQRNKIATMEKRNELIRLKKGLYVVSSKISRKPLSVELIANHLYGPSYISFETALAFYGLIPERVYSVRSATFKRAKRFDNAVGVFEYVTVPHDYFSIGISQQTVENEYSFLIATPEKAICDLLLAKNNLRLQSVKAMNEYLEEELRIDFSILRNIDTEIFKKCIDTGKKKRELTMLLRFLSEL